MTQKITNSNIDKNTEKKVEELFYSESNMKYLEKVITDIESGKSKLVEHDLIEE
jgi:addiction module antitoxin, relB/dinJ family